MSPNDGPAPIQAAQARHWRARAGSPFECEKRPARGGRGMVVTNHPLASAAGAEMLAEGGNAVDAAIAALFALSVVEPMMTGPLGGGIAHIRLADGTHRVIDGMATVPGAATPDMYAPTGEAYDVADRANAIGARAVCTPGNLQAWCETLARYGTFSLDDVLQPAIRHAARGFRITHFLADCIGDAASDLARDPGMAARYVPDGRSLQAGERLVQASTAESLRLIAREGADALRTGALGQALAAFIARGGGVLTQDDIARFAVIERDVVRGTYRGHEIVGPPPPSSAGVHIVQMLNILEGYDIAGIGFGTEAGMHLLAEVLKVAFADRAVATADPAFVTVPVARLMDKAYADERRAGLRLDRAGVWTAGVEPGLATHTTHLTVADAMGNVVASTQTINGLFGARILVPEIGLAPNNYMMNFDPVPGRAQSIAPGKRVPTSMAPMMVLRDGKLRFALGLPGGLRIFPCAMQAIVNLLDHDMSLQEAVEAPRLFTQGGPVEVEPAFSRVAAEGLRALGHEILPVRHVGGGMCAVAFEDDDSLTGAACWRADGTAVALGGGRARPGVRFWPDRPASMVFPANRDLPPAGPGLSR